MTEKTTSHKLSSSVLFPLSFLTVTTDLNLISFDYTE